MVDEILHKGRIAKMKYSSICQRFIIDIIRRKGVVASRVVKNHAIYTRCAQDNAVRSFLFSGLDHALSQVLVKRIHELEDSLPKAITGSRFDQRLQHLAPHRAPIHPLAQFAEGLEPPTGRARLQNTFHRNFTDALDRRQPEPNGRFPGGAVLSA